MSDITQSVFKAGKVLECLFQDDFQSKTILEIVDETQGEYPTTRRALQTWKELGWVIEIPITGQKATRWAVSRKLVQVAHAYERDAMNRVHAIKSEFKSITGKELNA